MSKEKIKQKPSTLQRFMASTGQPKLTAQVMLKGASPDLLKELSQSSDPVKASNAIVTEYYKATDGLIDPEVPNASSGGEVEE